MKAIAVCSCMVCSVCLSRIDTEGTAITQVATISPIRDIPPRASRAMRETPTTTTTEAPKPKAVVVRHKPPIPHSAPVEGFSGIIEYASQFVGTPYVWGGTSPSGFDCSGFIQFVYRSVGVSLPRVSGAQANAGVSVPFEAAQPGDIIAYSGHVTMYAGNGQMIGATSRGDVVRFQPVRAGFYSVRHIGNYNHVEKAA